MTNYCLLRDETLVSLPGSSRDYHARPHAMVRLATLAGVHGSAASGQHDVRPGLDAST